MLEPDSKQKDITQRRNPRPLIPDLDVPPVIPRWFHAIDNPIATRKRSSSNLPASPSTPKQKLSSKWLPFSKRDSEALEKAYQNNDVRAKVPVNEDHLFEVDVNQRTISPVYWEGLAYEVRRATWFMQSDGWVPCEENLAEQIELGFYKHKPYHSDTNNSIKQTSTDATAEEEVEEKKLELSLSKESKQWNLLGPYLGQYIVYTGEDKAWLLSNSTSSKFAKSIITRLTNKQNLGGTRLIRGYPAVKQRLSKKSKPKKKEGEITSEDEQTKEETTIEIEDEDMNHSEEGEVRKIDHLLFVIHGVGQKMSERTGQTFVHDVDVMRKTLKMAFPAAMATSATPLKSNGIQVLPIMWRQDIKFGMAAEAEEGYEADLGTVGVEDGCPTLDELTLDGVPNIRAVASDVLMDVPLYFTPRYREMMTHIISREINRVYRLFVEKNPDFLERKGQVSIFGHSLGSMLAFDVLTLQPDTLPTFLPNQEIEETDNKKLAPLLFPVKNFFAAGSPLGVILLLRGFKIASRKGQKNALSDIKSPSHTSINLCYPAVENLYNIFHKSDPVAYRLEPLIARHATAKLKPEPIPYMKGGLKSVLDAGYHVGSGIANRAGAMYESIKMGLTTSLFMRSLGLTRQQIYEDTHPASDNDEPEEPEQVKLTRVRSNSDPSSAADFAKMRKSAASNKALPPYSQGARKLKMLNVTGRVDYCLQEGLLENPYLSAFSAHMQYWRDLDVAAFLVRQIYYS